MRTCRTFALIVALLLLGAVPASRTYAGPPGPPSDTRGCPVIKPVATSEAPAPGKVELEITEADIEDQFSNRELAYKGNWDKAFLALDAAIDSKGSLHLARGPAPAPEDLDAAPLREGYLSRQLIEGPEAPIAPGARLSAAQVKAHLESHRGSRMLTLMLVNTIARVNKYGSTERGLREDALRAERYLADDLARASVDPSDSRSLYIANVRDEAFATLMGLLSVATPRQQEERAKRPPPAPNPRKRDLLPLDDFDRANAVLDVYLSRDAHGEHGIFTPPRGPIHHDGATLVENLAALAAARKEFGGNAAPGSPQDAVACKAFNTLVRIADARVPGTESLRGELLSLLLLSSSQYAEESAYRNLGHGAPEPLLFAVTRSASTVAGVSDKQEAKRAVDSIVDAMVSGAPDNLERMVDVLKFYQAHVGGDSHPMGREEVTAEIQRRFEIMQKRKDAGTAGQAERQALERWSTLSR